MKKRLFSVVMIATMLCSLFTAPVAASGFPDTVGHWAQKAIETWGARGVINGDDTGNFRPDDPITRAETATLIDNVIGFQNASNKSFPDVAPDAWYALAISKLYAADVLTGYEDDTIRPTANISRQEAAVIIARAFSINANDADQSILSQFADQDQIQAWARPVIAFMASKGFIQGSDGIFRPGDPITRAEIVTILDNMVGIYADGSSSSYSGNYGDKIAIIKAPAILDGVTVGGAVVCGTVKGKVNFNSGSRVNGCLCSWSSNASVSTAGASVASVSNKNGGTITSGGNYSAGYGGGSYAGGTGNASGGGYGGSTGGGYGGSTGGGYGGSTGGTNQYIVTFYANGGAWDSGATQGSVTYALGNSYALRLPANPVRSGYIFDGWYTSQLSANYLRASDKLVPTEMVTSTSIKNLYAGWRRPSGLYGTVAVTTGANVAGRGKSAEELMDNVALTETGAIDVYNATGGLRYVTGYTNSPTLNTEGNFLALTYTLPVDVDDPTAVILKTGFSDGSSEATYNSFTTENRSYTRVFEINAADLGKTIVFTVDVDGSNTTLNTITVDLSQLVRYEFRTASTLEDLTAALASNAVEKITVTDSIVLTSGTYAPASGRKAVVLEAPLQVAKDAEVTLKNLDIVANATLSALLVNTTELPVAEPTSQDATDEVEPIDDESSQEPPTPVVTKAESITLDGLNILTGSMDAVLNEIQVVSLTVKNSAFKHNGENTATALVIGVPTEGDTIVLEGNTFDNYNLALEYKDITALNTGDNVLKRTSFLNNTTDLKLNAQDIIPNIAYNYFDDTPVIAGPEGAISNYYGPLYTEDSLDDTTLTENLHDAYIFVDGALFGKLSALETISISFESEELPREILVIPADARDTAVSINEAEITSISLLKTDLPKELTIQVSDGTAKTITVTESAPLE